MLCCQHNLVPRVFALGKRNISLPKSENSEYEVAANIFINNSYNWLFVFSGEFAKCK